VNRALTALSLLFAAPVAAFASETAPTIPRPHGWIGTADDWARGLGIAFALLDLLLLAIAWRTLRRTGVSALSKEVLFGGIAVLPLAVVFFAYSYGLEASKEVEACGSCHVMTPWVADLRNPKSETLAALHFKNRYIQENHCYTCHSDYGMFGSVRAKWEGLGHVYYNTTGSYEKPIHIARPYSNLRCLNCHGESLKFLDPEKHPKEDLPDMISGKTSCLDCHGPAHAPQPEQKASR
jgi:nitrate/TMAO reductase-like tetraheme cytochrome c subunit